MPDYQAIYRNQAAQYELMVSREDYQGKLLPALNAVCQLEGLDIIELGAGTGRLTQQIAPLAGSLLALDVSEHMLDLLQKKLPQVKVMAADNRAIPLTGGIADGVIAGWSIAH
jgi:ubiquinone/menaquinone biosynthesis C-methylase UbiE